MNHSNQVNVSFQVIPINTVEAYGLIDEAIEIIQKSHINHRVQAFSTVLEGDLNEIMKLIEKVKNHLSVGEFIFNIQIQYNSDEDIEMENKIAGR